MNIVYNYYCIQVCCSFVVHVHNSSDASEKLICNFLERNLRTLEHKLQIILQCNEYQRHTSYKQNDRTIGRNLSSTF